MPYRDVEKGNKQTNERRRRIKIEVLTHYGYGKCACFRCGFADMRALTIDHIDGRGKSHDAHGRPLPGSKYGGRLYLHLRTAGYPAGYLTLCMNCQYIKRVEAKESNQW